MSEARSPYTLCEVLQMRNGVPNERLVKYTFCIKPNKIVFVLDVQPHHILLNNTNDKLKLCGFDMARYVKGPLRILPGLGTANYRAPEVIVGFPCGYGIDVWAAAVVMYEIATNGKLFPGIFNNDILFKQMCTLGSMPVDMIERSTFRSQHFYGTSFRRFKSRNKKVMYPSYNPWANLVYNQSK